MGRSAKSNFDKRFGGRIRIVYAQKMFEIEKRNQYGKLCKAIKQVLSGILGREPTQRELMGIDDISKNIKKYK